MFNRRIIKYLEEWKNRTSRKPLILRGARQVGKTFSVRLLAEKCFQNFVEINLDDPEQEQLFRNPLSLEDFEKTIQLKFNQPLKDHQTLLFIDEIQNSPNLIKLLRFFYEKRPNLHVIAAGSLLEAKLKKEGLSFPVGRVEFAYLYPLDFFEFLEAKGQKDLIQTLTDASINNPLAPPIRELAGKAFNEYLLVGGMPEAVACYVADHDFHSLNRIYNALLTSYFEDLPKYVSEAKVKYLGHCLENAPLFAGQTISYENFGDSSYRSREMSQAFDALEKAMLVYRVMGSRNASLPLIGKKKKAPKIVFLDVGLVNYRLGIRDKLLTVNELNDFFRGRIAEQVVAQHLLAQKTYSQPQIYYWFRDFPGSTAEIDFIFARHGRAIPLEVKSGKSGRLRSLKEFIKLSKTQRVYRVYSGELKLEPVRIENVKFELLSIPFYLLPRLPELTIL